VDRRPPELANDYARPSDPVAPERRLAGVAWLARRITLEATMS
jgi:hypothetical protein